MKTQPTTTRLFDRNPPHNTEAERSVLGSMLINPQAVAQAVEVLGENSTDAFYIQAHQHVYDAAVALYRRNHPADLVTVAEELSKRGLLEAAGGVTAVADLTGAAPTSANVEHYSEIVLGCALSRRLIQACSTLTARAYDGGDEIQELLEGAEQEMFQLCARRQTNRIWSASELVGDALEKLKKSVKSGSAINGLPTGFHALDRLLSGMQPSDMIVIAARPSIGKSAFALNIAANAAIKEKKGVLIFTLEMSKEQFMSRLLCMVGEVDLTRLREGFLVDDEIRKAQKAMEILSHADIYMDESVGLTPLELRARARRHAAHHPNLGLIIIDYMQLMHVAKKTESRQAEISEISRAIKEVARELHVPVVALAQLNREADKNETGTPMLSHLRESGSIEQDTDVVMMLSKVDKERRKTCPDNIAIHISKQRNGPTGQVEVIFRKGTQQFLPVDDHGAPAPPRMPYNDEPTDLEGGGYHEDEIPFNL
jgi:replicative DNA helicase